jgi:hypothetical protein
MDSQKSYSLMQRFARILAWVLIVLSVLCGAAYLGASSYFYLQGEPISLPFFVLIGVTFTLTAILSCVMLLGKDKPFVYFTFFFTGLYALVLDVVLLIRLPRTGLSATISTVALVLLLVNIFAILASFVLPVFRLFGQNGPTWAFMVAYFLEMGLWIGTIAVFGQGSSADWTFLLLCGITLLRSSQYEYLGPSEPLARRN